MSTLWERAVAVLDANWTGHATLPSRHQYPHQWSWDSAFICIGLARVFPERARTELTSLFGSQWESGRVPQIVFSEDSAGYFPGPQFWNTRARSGRATSGIIQPPVHARAALTVHHADAAGSTREQFLERLYPRLAAWHDYLLGDRDLAGDGLAAIVHPWESGLDNSPAWDHVLATAPAAPSETVARRDTVHVEASQRPTDADYRAYIALAQNYRDSGYADAALDDHDFRIEDPLFNTLLLDAELCLARIAELLGTDPSRHVAAARVVHNAMLERLWDGSAQRFAARDLRTNTLSNVTTIGSLVPLLDPWLPDAIRATVAHTAASAEFAGGCPCPVPSTALTDPKFDPRRYWRGPTWINTNWLLWLGAATAGYPELAATIKSASVALASTQGFREYFDPLTGQGLGADDFSWTAALTLDFLSDPSPPSAPFTDQKHEAGLG